MNASYHAKFEEIFPSSTDVPEDWKPPVNLLHPPQLGTIQGREVRIVVESEPTIDEGAPFLPSQQNSSLTKIFKESHPFLPSLAKVIPWTTITVLSTASSIWEELTCEDSGLHISGASSLCLSDWFRLPMVALACVSICSTALYLSYKARQVQKGISEKDIEVAVAWLCKNKKFEQVWQEINKDQLVTFEITDEEAKYGSHAFYFDKKHKISIIRSNLNHVSDFIDLPSYVLFECMNAYQRNRFSAFVLEMEKTPISREEYARSIEFIEDHSCRLYNEIVSYGINESNWLPTMQIKWPANFKDNFKLQTTRKKGCQYSHTDMYRHQWDSFYSPLYFAQNSEWLKKYPELFTLANETGDTFLETVLLTNLEVDLEAFIQACIENEGSLNCPLKRWGITPLSYLISHYCYERGKFDQGRCSELKLNLFRDRIKIMVSYGAKLIPPKAQLSEACLLITQICCKTALKPRQKVYPNEAEFLALLQELSQDIPLPQNEAGFLALLQEFSQDLPEYTE